jgi:hypothetical protein
MRVYLDGPFQSDAQELMATHINTFQLEQTLTQPHFTSFLSLARQPLMHAGGAAQAERWGCAAWAELRRWSGGAGAQLLPEGCCAGHRVAGQRRWPGGAHRRSCAGGRAVLRRRPSGPCVGDAGPAARAPGRERRTLLTRAELRVLINFFFNLKVRVHHGI